MKESQVMLERKGQVGSIQYKNGGKWFGCR